MAHKSLLTSALALALCSGTAIAQVNTSTVQVIEPAQQISPNVVRAQFIRPGDVSPEEYARLLAEADRIKNYQQPTTSMASSVTYNAVTTQGSTTELATQPYSQYAAQQNIQSQPVYSQGYTGQTYTGTTYTAGQQPTYQTYTPSYTSSLVTNTSPEPTYAVPQNTQTYAARTYSANTQTPAATYTTPVAAHNVMKGDTLYNISKRYGVSLTNLKSANRLSGNIISIGQILTIPSVNKIVPAQDTSTAFSTRTTQTYAPTQSYGTTYVRSDQPLPRSGVYAVLPKDTLFSIARFACVSPADVAQVNGLSNASILQPGQKLTMPGGHCLN